MTPEQHYTRATTNLAQVLGFICGCTVGQKPPCKGCRVRADILYKQLSPDEPAPA